MKVFDNSTEVEITGVSDFDLEKTFECGQCFRWNAEEDGTYIGVAFGRAAGIRRCGKSVLLTGSIDDFETIWRRYFDLDRDYADIRKQLCVDEFMKRATAFGVGIRLLRQDKWEALCSFIISQNNNIPRIKGIISTLCREFGEPIVFEDRQLFTFPSASVLAALDVESLAPLRCGYRAQYMINAARMVSDGTVDLDVLAQSSPETARAALKRLNGVGDKVADCVMLFGLHMLDAFPLDVWMKRAVVQHYGPNFDPGIFDPYAGIAQQYIFHYSRSGGL